MRLDKRDEDVLRQDGADMRNAFQMTLHQAEPSPELWQKIRAEIEQPQPVRAPHRRLLQRDFWHVLNGRLVPAMQIGLAGLLAVFFLSFETVGTITIQPDLSIHSTGTALQSVNSDPELAPGASTSASADSISPAVTSGANIVHDIPLSSVSVRSGYFNAYPPEVIQRKQLQIQGLAKQATIIIVPTQIQNPVDEHRRQLFAAQHQEQIYNDRLSDYIQLHLPKQ